MADDGIWVLAERVRELANGDAGTRHVRNHDLSHNQPQKDTRDTTDTSNQRKATGATASTTTYKQRRYEVYQPSRCR